MTEYKELWIMLSNYGFELGNQLNKSLKCSICDKLLNNACVGECGCKYCWKCISNYLGNVSKKCPGNMGKCKFTKANLSLNIIKDNETNIAISKLKVKCPSITCSYRSDLLLMVKHMKVCEARILPCPFNEMGCPELPMTQSKLSTHLLDQICSHNQSMNNWGMNIKNDILAQSVIKKQEIVELCTKKIQLEIDAKISQAILKGSKSKEQKSFEEYDSDLKNLKNQYEELTNLFMEVTEYSNGIIEQLTNTNKEQANLINQLKNTNEKLLNDIAANPNSNPNSTNPNSNPNSTNPEPQKISLGDWIGQSNNLPRNHFATITWDIINVIELREKGSSFKSDLFLSCCNTYAMQLIVHMNGCERHRVGHICFEVCCYENNVLRSAVHMPRVKIALIINNRQRIHSSVSECKSVPTMSCREHKLFHFKYSDLSRKSVLSCGEISIECAIDQIT